MQDNVVEMTLPPKPEYVSLARLAVVSLARDAGLSEDEVFDIKLAVSEACTNAIQHKRGMGSYSVEIQCDGGCIEVRVIDRGRPFTPEELQVVSRQFGDYGGFGLMLVNAVADEFSVDEHEEGGTVVRFTKLLKCSNPTAGAH